MSATSNTTTDQPTLAVSQMRRARVHAALRSIEEGTRLDDLTDDEIDMIIDAARDHRTTHEPRPAGDLREAAQRVVDDYPAAAGACASIEGGDGKPGWGSIRRLAEALATHSPAPMAGEVERLREALTKITKVRVNGWDNIWAGANRCREIADAALAAHPSTQEGDR